jgi:2-O-methyltransferase
MNGQNPMGSLSVKSYIKNKLPPYVKRPIRKLLDRALGPPPLTLTPLTHEAIAELVKRPDPTILEIGCNNGSDTLSFLRVMPQAKIYCFEPDPRAIAHFKKHLDPFRDNV